MRNFIALIFCFSVLLFSACEKDSGPIIIKPEIPEDTVPDFVSFANDIQPIFNFNCIACHNENHPFLNLKECCSWDQLLNSGVSAPYIDTLNPTESYLYIRVAGAGQNPPEMPPGGPFLIQEETDLILKWIQEGAKDN